MLTLTALLETPAPPVVLVHFDHHKLKEQPLTGFALTIRVGVTVTEPVKTSVKELIDSYIDKRTSDKQTTEKWTTNKCTAEK